MLEYNEMMSILPVTPNQAKADFSLNNLSRRSPAREGKKRLIG